MAIAAGRRLSDRLFGGLDGAKADYTNVPVRRTLRCFEALFLRGKICRCLGAVVLCHSIEDIPRHGDIFASRFVLRLAARLAPLKCVPYHAMLATADSGFFASAHRDNRPNRGAGHQGTWRGQHQGLHQHGTAR